MMDNIINVNNVATYPKTFLDFCKKNKECLIYTFSDIDSQLDYDSSLFDIVNKMFENYKFECIHASRIKNVNDIKSKGILNPFVQNELCDIIMNGINVKIDHDKLNLIKNKIKNIIKNKSKY